MENKELLELIVELLGVMRTHFDTIDKLLEELVSHQVEIDKQLDILFKDREQDLVLEEDKLYAEG